ncbi:ggdef domain protein, putative [Heliomicrobium modesticaldum Ice1]|uniref:Ggdef domain protein, putative n=1 Tax=Heliobacterium modesticaldum (strain ATCC 51547 / Ice1) TaxID=498761 RepID=B0TH60_HELMI|nr:sensor domain-containing diguanylate cyclase [Heliomicrobium modesticaldum]ABZ84735.1 ggdef domain protein, putative [Heliomicrobium modesticaldum Ice1]
MEYFVIGMSAVVLLFLTYRWQEGRRHSAYSGDRLKQTALLERRLAELEGQVARLALERDEALRTIESQRMAQEELDELTRQNYILHEINRAINTTVDEGEIVTIILQAMVTLTGAESASIILFDGEDVRIVSHCGFAEGEPESLSEAFRESIAWQVLTTGQPFIHGDPGEYRRYRPSLANYVASIPLTFIKEVIGCINIHSMGPRYLLTPSKAEILQILAGQAALALKNASMYHQLKQQNEYFARQAVTDGLTGLYNHRYFQQCLQELMKERPVTLLLFDIDHFKGFNDTYGHPCGDEILRQIAHILRSQLGPQEVAARYGGEEFAVILPDADLRRGIERAEQIRQAVANFCFRNPDRTLCLNITVSIGVSEKLAGWDKSRLIEAADRALYRAKEQGRNRVCADLDREMSVEAG